LNNIQFPFACEGVAIALAIDGVVDNDSRITIFPLDKRIIFVLEFVILAIFKTRLVLKMALEKPVYRTKGSRPVFLLNLRKLFQKLKF